jgi:epoxyqueuosine reductase
LSQKKDWDNPFFFAMKLVDEIKNALRQSGFVLVGLTQPLPPPHLLTYYRWLDEGRQAGMTYLATEVARAKRADPRLVFPGVQTILVVGLPYGGSKPEAPTPPGEISGRIASYAWGRDYHDLIPPRLTSVMSSFFRPEQFRVYSDTGPILERDYALQAGLGWIGKNTCLIHPRHGSYFLLGIALLEAVLQPDPPFAADRCGSCRRCIEACPTGCILPDRTIDSNRCISYLTIEHKGPIPGQLRPLLGDWVFGCDICQAVCPWNGRFADLPADPQLAIPAESSRPHLTEELKLTPEQFNQKYHGTPLLRAKRRGYLRNVAVALGNQPDPRSVPALAQAVTGDAESLVRGHAAWALGQIGTSQATRTLEQALKAEAEPRVREDILVALERGKV